MIYADYRQGKVDNTLEVDIICSNCKTKHTVIIDRVSKLTMSICPHCFNIDIEKTGSNKIPVNVEKQLRELMTSKLLDYTVNGQPLAEFMQDLSLTSILSKETNSNDIQSYSGLYRLKSYYSRAKAKKQLNLEDFPSFEEFMRWSIKQGYRDWKTLKPDNTDMISKQSYWVPGGYIKNGNTALQLATSCMITLYETKEKLMKLLAEQEQTITNPDLVSVNQLIVNTIHYINEHELDLMNKL